MNKQKILNNNEEKLIVDRINVFENNTNTELILAIANESDPYPAAKMRMATLLSFISTFIFSILFELQFQYLIVVLLIIIFIFLLFINRFFHLDQYFLSPIETEMETEQKAIEVFFHHCLNTKHQMNALLFISIKEKKIRFITNKGLKEKFDNTKTNEVVNILSNNFKNGLFKDGLIKSIEFIESEIKKEFPNSSLIKNELSNEILWIE